MKRTQYQELIKWKNNPKRKVLLLRGARQVGKTYIIRELGKYFDHFIEVNFEIDRDVATFFSGNLNPDEICLKLSAYYKTPIIEAKTLLFFDEIQICPDALKSLRFFYEKKPNLHVIGAGSFLEFALEELSTFAVGRIHCVFLYPMSFEEFLIAAHEEGLIEQIRNASTKKPLDKAFHNKAIDWLKKFLITGGMPEVVKTFFETHDWQKVQEIQADIILSLEDDFSKYKKRANTIRLKDVFNAVVRQTGNKFIISKASEIGNQQQKTDALEMLVNAGLCYKVLHTSANGLPLAFEQNEKKFKMVFFDCGLFQRILQLDIGQYMIADDIDYLNKGNVVELFAGTEIVKAKYSQEKVKLFYWHKETKGSNAEVDYITEIDHQVVPIEVKSGTQGKMQSLFTFMKEKKVKYGIRTSLENFSEQKQIRIIPVYGLFTIFN